MTPLHYQSSAPPPSAFSAPKLPAWVVNLILTLLLVVLWFAGKVIQEHLNPYYFDILIKIGISIILAVSLNLINGITGQFSLGHAGFMAVGAYVAASVFKYFDPVGMAAHWVFLGVLVGGGFAAAIAGAVVGIPALRLRGDYLAVATLGFGEIIRVVINKIDWIGPFEIGAAKGLKGIPTVPLDTYFFWTFAWVIVCVVAIWRLTYSAHGRAFVAIREDETAAAAMGVDTTFFKVAAFVVGAFFAGTAGGLFAMWNGLLDPKGFGFMKSIDVVVMVVLGGSGSITGSILAAAVLTYLPEQLRFLQEWRMVIYSVLLILMMLLRPEGLLGRHELWWTRRKLAPAATTDPQKTSPPANPSLST